MGKPMPMDASWRLSQPATCIALLEPYEWINRNPRKIIGQINKALHAHEPMQRIIDTTRPASLCVVQPEV